MGGNEAEVIIIPGATEAPQVQALAEGSTVNEVVRLRLNTCPDSQDSVINEKACLQHPK